MIPDHETDTLEGLIARWFEIAARPIKPAHERPGREVYKKCADELAPILAGLRGLRNEWLKVDPARAMELDAKLGQPATGDSHGK